MIRYIYKGYHFLIFYNKMNYPRSPSIEAYLTDINQAIVFIAETRKVTTGKPSDNKKDLLETENKRLGRLIYLYSTSGPRYQFLKRNQYNQARNDLVSLNLTYVISIAKKYRGKGVALDDLIQEGNLGLIRAAKLYNPDHTKEGIKFSTYATRWIESFIKRAVQEKLRDNLPIPYKTCSDRKRIEHITALLTEELGEKPSSQQIADRFNLEYYPDGPKNSWIDNLHVEGLWVATTLQERIDRLNEHGEYYGEIDSKSPTPYEILANQNERENLIRILEKEGILDEREKTVIIGRFGLYGGEEMTLKQIGEELGLTRERVRQIERDSLLKLRDYMVRENKDLSEDTKEGKRAA